MPGHKFIQKFSRLIKKTIVLVCLLIYFYFLLLGFSCRISCTELRQLAKYSNYSWGTFYRGGFYIPSDCISNGHIAIIVPFRARELQLPAFMSKIVPFLKNQYSSFQILVVHQNDTLPFNRAALFNVGVSELKKIKPKFKFSCYIFHDVDHIPLNPYNFYECEKDGPILFSSAVDKWNYSIPYENFFGGVVGLTSEQYSKIGGFPNCFWGWGGEDDAIFWKIQVHGMKTNKKNGSIGKYDTLPHSPSTKNPARETILKEQKKRRNVNANNITEIDSLRYEVVSLYYGEQFIKISVDLSKLNKSASL